MDATTNAKNEGGQSSGTYYWELDIDGRVLQVLIHARRMGIIKLHDPVVVVTGHLSGTGNTNMLRLVYCPADEEEGRGILYMPKINVSSKKSPGKGKRTS